MTRLFSTAFTVLLLLASCASCSVNPFRPSHQPTQSVVVAKALEATIVVHDEKFFLICAGERVSPTLLLTAFHCVVAATLDDQEEELLDIIDPMLEKQKPEDYVGRSISYTTYAETILAGQDKLTKGSLSTILRIDTKHDLALLQTDPSLQPFVEVRTNHLFVGEPVFAIGHPAGLEYSFSLGYVSNQCRWLSGPECWTQVDMSIWGGNSGGGLYDMDGKLVGVASRRILSTYAFFTPPDPIADIVNQ